MFERPNSPQAAENAQGAPLQRFPQPRPTAHPSAGRAKPKGNSIYKIARLIENIFSHRGLFVLGVAVAIICFYFNCSFWVAVIQDVLGYGPAASLLFGFLISMGTSIFQVLPAALRQSRRLKLQQLFSAAIKPAHLPAINDKVVPDAEQMLTEYKESDRARRKFFNMMRWLAYGMEVLMGIIFLGRVGAGFGAIVRLALFIFSIIGVEWGISLALRASQDELPPSIRAQFDELIEKSNQQLSLKEIR